MTEVERRHRAGLRRAIAEYVCTRKRPVGFGRLVRVLAGKGYKDDHAIKTICWDLSADGIIDFTKDWKLIKGPGTGWD